MEKFFMRNIYNARWVIGGLVGFSFTYWKVIQVPNLKKEVFGWDGNGGRMIKIITDLTDEEIARMKHQRRVFWHYRGRQSLFHGQEKISD